MDKKLIEIPLGTNSELLEETITIPDGCYAVIEGNKVIIKKKKAMKELNLEEKTSI